MLPRWTIEQEPDGPSCLRLENDLIQATIVPSIGGKIWELWHKPTQCQWIWHNPNHTLHVSPRGSNYDANWAGGWEELFPNDSQGMFMDRALPDHGEWWTDPWEWEIAEESESTVSIRLWMQGIVTNTLCEKWIEVDRESPELSVRYRITNLESQTLHFLFKQHLAVQVSQSHRLELPGGTVTRVDRDFSTRIEEDAPFEWPMTVNRSGEVVDLSVFPPPEDQHREFVYIRDLPEGWCGVRDLKTGSALRLHFPQEVFPYVWLFMPFGGWQDAYTVVLEPCTNMPKDLHEAYQLGQCGQLAPQAMLECDVRVVLS